MLSKLFFVLALICLSSCKKMPEATKWDVTITNADGTSDIKIYKGKYTQVLLTLTMQEEPEPVENNLKRGFIPSYSIIKLKQDANSKFKTSHNQYIIDTSESVSYTVYLGVSCTENMEAGIYILTFEEYLDISQSVLTFKDFSVELIEDPKQNIIDLSPILTELPSNSKSLFKLNSELTNVDDIKIKFTNDQTEYSYINTLQFKALDDIRGFFIDSSYNGFVGEFGVYNYEENNTVHTYEVSIDNKCYTTTLGDTFEFTTTDGSVAILDKNEIINSFTKLDSEEEDAIEVSFSVPAPVILYAALSSDDEFDNMKDIIDFKKNDKVKYNKYFITEPQDSFVLKFTELGRKTKYRLMIILQNTSIDETKNYITITVGHFKGADIVMSLFPRSANDFPAQCATWTFENEVPKNFAKLAEQYCAYTFNENVNEKDFFKGCSKCQSVNPINKNSNQAVICVYNKEKCKKKYEGDPIEVFKHFVESINTAEKINETFEIENATVVSYNIEIDNNEPDKEKIVAIFDSQVKNKLFKFNVTSQLDQAIECNYKKNIDRSIRKRWITPENLKERALIIQPGETATLEAFLPNVKPDNKTYNIYLNCYYLPNFDHQFFSTGAFVAGTFLYTDVDEPVFPPEKEIDCTKEENKAKPKCIKRDEPNYNITFKSAVPEVYENAVDDADDLSRLSFGYQYIMIDNEYNNFLKSIPKERSTTSSQGVQDIIDSAVRLLEQLESYNCTNTFNYDLCRTLKKQIQAQIVATIKVFFNCEQISSLIQKLTEFTPYEEAIKKFMLLFATAVKNADSMNKGDTEYYSGLVYCLMDNFEDIWNEFNKTAGKSEEELQNIKEDLTVILMDTLSGLAESTKFDEADEYIKEKLHDGKMLITEQTKKIRESIRKVAKMFWEYGAGQFETDSIIVNITINLEEPKNKRLRAVDEDTSYLEFSEYGIKVGFKVKSLMASYGAKYAEVILYKNYPLRSVTNDVVSPVFIAITLYDKDKNEIPIKNIVNEMLPEIFYDIVKHKFPTCVYYDEASEELQKDGITSEQREGYIVCKVTHFTDFSVADNSVVSGLSWWGIMIIILVVAALLFGGVVMWRKLVAKGMYQSSNYVKA